MDWNNDTYNDILVGDSAGGVTVFLNTNTNENPVLNAGSKIQLDGVDLNAGARAASIVNDWDGDGRKDLVIGNWDGKINVYLNSGSDSAPVFVSSDSSYLNVGGSVLDMSDYNSTGTGGRAAPRIYDWNNDGLKDLLVGEYEGHIYFLENVGTNSAPVFDSAEQLILSNGDSLDANIHSNPVMNNPRSRFDITDWNEDGQADIVVGQLDGNVELYMAPEPLSSTLLLVGGGILVFRRTRKKKKLL